MQLVQRGALSLRAAAQSRPAACLRQRLQTMGVARTALPGPSRVHSSSNVVSWQRRDVSIGSVAEVEAQTADARTQPASSSTGPGGRPNIVQVLRQRGLIQEVTSDDLEASAASTSLAVYCGFDPTADSLHLGNLLGIIVLSWFQRCGHTPVALLGGATGRVGDPSGRSSERPVLSEQEIEQNVQSIGSTLSSILQRNAAPGCPPMQVANNLDWFGSMSFLAFLRDIGKYARVGTMLAKDSVRTRFESEQGISFTEFTYQLLQGYDFVHLCKEHGVRVQVGGSDQWGNITAGTDLVRKLLGGEEREAPSCYGLTFPLLVDSEGRKFGKSTGGAIWLGAHRLSPYKFFQHLFAVADADVIKFLKMLTFLDLEEIARIEGEMQGPGYRPNTAQRRLAEEVTRFVHGEEGLQEALRATEALKPGADTALDAATLEASNAPSAQLPRSSVEGALVVDVMVAAKMLPSKAEVRRMIKNGGVYLNNGKVADAERRVEGADLIEGRLLLLAAGKKNKMLVRVES